MIKLNFKLTENDYLFVRKIIQAESNFMNNLIITVMLLVIILLKVFTDVHFFYENDLVREVIFILITYVVIRLVVYYFSFYRSAISDYKRLGFASFDHRYEFDEKGVKYSSINSNFFIRYDIIHSVFFVKKGIVMMMGDSFGHYLPFRIFQNEDQKEICLDLIKRSVDKDKQKSI